MRLAILPTAPLLTLILPFVAARAELLLTVDPATGQAQISATLLTVIDGYAVLSASGSLTPATWNSFQDQLLIGWEQSPPFSASSAVAELNASRALVFDSQSSVQLGQLFRTVGATQDLRLEYVLPDEQVPRQGVVTYGAITVLPAPFSLGLSGDYNSNGIGDAADYVVWRNFVNQDVPIPNDRTQNSVTPGDYDEWRLHFGVNTLTPTSNVPADASGNGVTDINDYIIIRNNFLGTGKTLATGDINGDSIVNFADFRLWKMARTDGSSAGSGNGALTRELHLSVPEPGILVLSLPAITVLTCTQRGFCKRHLRRYTPLIVTCCG